MNLTLPRGIRNHNPGNIERDGTPWQGLADDQSTDPRFCVFRTAPDGIRALARLLITYQDKHGLRTVRGIINRYAPPVENNTSAYVAAVARALDIAPDDPLDVHQYATMAPLVRAIIRHENGDPRAHGHSHWYAQWEIDEGLHRVGVIPPRTPQRVIGTPEAIGSGVAGAAGLSAAGGALMDTSLSLRHAGDGSAVISGLVAVLIIAGVALTLYGLMRRARS